MTDKIRGREITLVYKMTESIRYYLLTAGLSMKEADMISDSVKQTVSSHLATHYNHRNHRD